jgi:hypothetical protein
MASLEFVMRGFLAVTLRMVAIPADRRIGNLVATLVIAIEATLALFFAAGLVPTATALAAVSLLSLFGLISVAATLRSARIQCMCFGATGAMLGKGTLLRAAGLGGVAMGYVLLDRYDVAARFPSDIGKMVSLLSLVAAAALLMQWVGMAPSLAALVAERRVAADEDGGEAEARIGPTPFPKGTRFGS